MRIKLLVGLAGARTMNPGDVINVAKAEGLRMVKAQIGEETTDPVGPLVEGAPETAAAPHAGVETASGRRLFGAAAAAVARKLAKAG